MNITPAPAWFNNLGGFSFFSDFVESPDTTNVWALTATDSGSVSVSGTGGIAALVASDGTVADNDEAYLANKNSIFKVTAGQPIYAEALLQFTEANTDDANVFFGFGSSVAANFLVDDGGGPRASGTVIGLYKVDGGTVWRAVSRNGSTVTDSVSTTTAGGSNYQRLTVEIFDVTTSQCSIVFRVDGNLLRDSSNNIIKHVLPISGVAAMQVVAALKNGGANLETLNIDYLGAVQASGRV